MSHDDRRQLIAGLREVAEFYERMPGAYYDGMTILLNMYAGGRRAAKDLAAMAAAFGEWTDLSDRDYVVIAKKFGAKVRLQLFAPRAKVCRRVVIGARVEPPHVLPAREEIRIPERTVELVEWLCPALRGMDPGS